MLEVANLDFKNSHQFDLLNKEHDDKANPDVEPVQVYISKATFYVSDTLITVKGTNRISIAQFMQVYLPTMHRGSMSLKQFQTASQFEDAALLGTSGR